MKRAQLLLEEWQYRVIQDLAKKKRKSVSAVVRDLIVEKITKIESKEDPIFKAVGMVAGKAGNISENLDERLYQR